MPLAFLVQIIVALVIVGLVLWVVQQLPIDPAIMRIIRVVVVVVVCVWLLILLLNMFGGVSGPVFRR